MRLIELLFTPLNAIFRVRALVSKPSLRASTQRQGFQRLVSLSCIALLHVLGLRKTVRSWVIPNERTFIREFVRRLSVGRGTGWMRLESVVWIRGGVREVPFR